MKLKKEKCFKYRRASEKFKRGSIQGQNVGQSSKNNTDMGEEKQVGVSARDNDEK